MFVECPLCHEVKYAKGLLFHLRNKHPNEFNEVGYQKIKERAKKMKERPKSLIETEEKKPHEIVPIAVKKEDKA